MSVLLQPPGTIDLAEWDAELADIETAARRECERQRGRNLARNGLGMSQDAIRHRRNASRTFWRSVNNGPPEPFSPSFYRHRRAVA